MTIKWKTSPQPVEGNNDLTDTQADHRKEQDQKISPSKNTKAVSSRIIHKEILQSIQADDNKEFRMEEEEARAEKTIFQQPFDVGSPPFQHQPTVELTNVSREAASTNIAGKAVSATPGTLDFPGFSELAGITGFLNQSIWTNC